jgi:NAD(P)-dependent dehydrogenase (short-subunit alcohol dehydrogenase family)
MTYLESLFSLEGKTALVTGAARGNGKAIAEGLLRAGASVMLVDRLEQELTSTVSVLSEDGLPAFAYVCDLTGTGAVEQVVSETTAVFGRFDILVNNAGISLAHETITYPDEAWQATLSANLEVPFRLSKAAAAVMKGQGGGSIINITSLNAELAFPDNPAYLASKGGLKQLGKSLALDLAPYNVRVNNIGPGYIHTKMTHGSWSDPEKHQQRCQRVPLGRWGKPEDLVGVVVFLSASASSYITGQDIYVDGGWLIKGL